MTGNLSTWLKSAHIIDEQYSSNALEIAYKWNGGGVD